MPFPPTVARYTDNYILMLSSSKIFSYAGQRMALACISDKLFDRQFPALAERYKDAGVFGPTLIASILYMITSGCTASTQYAYAEMLRICALYLFQYGRPVSCDSQKYKYSCHQKPARET